VTASGRPADLAGLIGSKRPGLSRRGKRIGAFQKWQLANARPEVAVG